MVVASFAFFLYKSKDRTNGTMFTKKPNLSAPKKNEIENEPFHTKYVYFDTFNPLGEIIFYHIES